MNVRRPGVSSVKVQKKRTSLTFPRAVPLEAWISIGVEIFSITDASSWWLGDWLIYGQNRYPDRYKRAIEASSLHYKTLRNYAWVARKFDVSRRRDTLSMQHHAEVAALTEEEQELWLDRAEQEGWSVTELRRNIKESKATGDRIQDVTAATVTLKAPAERMRRWEQAASRAGTSLDEWIQRVLDREAVELLQHGDLVGVGQRHLPL
ncbi:LmbU family transcriptional regulator [Streptomyces sp. NBC_00557]|uniref:LmbU family transcriptional regulator n=1 Tax=Streptomyces sp. NBC_00557 TaxID=2975776 RepID=UPI002E7FD2B3|nr:LmbU family transcriptional regulator [Streptomyces sp. NBC_00557]WUC40319.1 LmbU family transcriptional regulator [Streptomyces sp. NBC_00557]